MRRLVRHDGDNARQPLGKIAISYHRCTSLSSSASLTQEWPDRHSRHIVLNSTYVQSGTTAAAELGQTAVASARRKDRSPCLAPGAAGIMADAATTALIARMMAEDAYAQGPADLVDSGAEESGSDYDERRPAKKRKAISKAAKPLKRVAGQAKKVQDAEARENQPELANGGGSATGAVRQKRRDAGDNIKEKRAPRSWSEQEHNTFLEGLVLHGRDWKAIAKMLACKCPREDGNQRVGGDISSHAQKHFIKECIAGKLLPAKVQESGAGYTLGGGLLNPFSRSAVAYGLTEERLQQLKDAGAASLAGLDMEASPDNAAQQAGPKGRQRAPRKAAATKEANAEAATNAEAAAAPAVAGAAEPSATEEPAESTKVEVKVDPPPASTQAGEHPPAPTEPTEYMKNRPRREMAGQKAALGQTTESLALQQCLQFSGPIASGGAQAQPFHMDVAARASWVMDLHAHLSNYEVIGLLGGTWDPAAQRIQVKEAYPCSRACGSDSNTGVELDAESAVAAHEAMHVAGLVAVGWYHSHPNFAPQPSDKDNDNQRNYQAQFRDEQSRQEPFVGAIVGPYHLHLPTEASGMTWWVVRSKGGKLLPFQVRMGIILPGLPETGDDLDCCLSRVTGALEGDSARVDLLAQWRGFARLVGETPEGGPLTNLDKLRAALRVHAAGMDEAAITALAQKTTAHLKEAWKVELPLT